MRKLKSPNVFVAISTDTALHAQHSIFLNSKQKRANKRCNLRRPMYSATKGCIGRCVKFCNCCTQGIASFNAPSLHAPSINPNANSKRKKALIPPSLHHSIVPKVPSVAIAFLGLDLPPSSVVGLRCLNVNPTNKLLLMGSSLSAIFSSAVCFSWTSLYFAISASLLKSSK